MDQAASALVQLGAKTLASLAPGERATVAGVGGPIKERIRLLELGLVPGTELSAVRRAPLGDPLEIELRGYRLSLANAEARHVRLAANVAAVSPTASAIEVVRAARRASPGTPLRVGLLGNPNTGKSTLFSALSGRHVTTGNYPGITVSRTTASLTLPTPFSEAPVTLVDLPGCYSLIGRSLDEDVAAMELLAEAAFELGGGGRGCDACIVVLDATALERSLYLLVQVLECGLPVVCALNMSDEAHALGIELDARALESALGVPVVATVATRGHGLPALCAALSAQLAAEECSAVRHGGATGETLERAAALLGRDARPSTGVAAWWLSALDTGKSHRASENAGALRDLLPTPAGAFSEQLVRERYAFVDALSEKIIVRRAAAPRRLTDTIDRLLTHPVFGTLSLLGLLGLCFSLLFTLSQPMIDAIEGATSWLRAAVQSALPAHWLVDLLCDGIIVGAGTVLAFLPQIALLLFLMTTLEAAGYLSRAAFLIDRVMRAVGLNGKAFVPMLSGFACAVPAILSLKTLENQRDRLLTMCVIPLMSCSARLPIYTLVIGVLFPASVRWLGVPISAWLLLLMYASSTLMAMLAASVLARTRRFAGMSPPLVLELPPYRMPQWSSVLRTVARRSREFLATAGTTIVVLSCVLWLMLHFPRPPVGTPEAEQLERSIAGHIGHAIEPAIAPLGFDWKIGIGLIGSFAAREVFVATMGVIHGTGEDEASLSESLRAARTRHGAPLYTPRTGLALMFFFMLAAQCMSTLAVIRRESGSWRWPVFVFSYMTALAYLAALAINQIGMLVG